MTLDDVRQLEDQNTKLKAEVEALNLRIEELETENDALKSKSE